MPCVLQTCESAADCCQWIYFAGQYWHFSKKWLWLSGRLGRYCARSSFYLKYLCFLSTAVKKILSIMNYFSSLLALNALFGCITKKNNKNKQKFNRLPQFTNILNFFIWYRLSIQKYSWCWSIVVVLSLFGAKITFVFPLFSCRPAEGIVDLYSSKW